MRLMPRDLPDPNPSQTLYYENRLAEVKRSVGAAMREAELAREVPPGPTNPGPLRRLLNAMTRVFTGS